MRRIVFLNGATISAPYLRIAALRDELPHVPVLALTASATPDVQKDICEKLAFHNEQIFRQSFERPNLSYSVFKVDSKINKIIEILQKVPGTGIIYCRSRKRTKEISELPQLQHISADYYHAGLPQEERSRKQEQWINNKIRVIVCTNAFGMGIDKPNVRSVIHADVPDCLENYYQEAGRAGRDGKTSYAVLLFDENDLAELELSASQRFPSIEDIRAVYQSVANYLQLPTGGGDGQYYDFDIVDFLRKFKLQSHTTLYSLKALEQDGWMAFNEQVFLSSSVRFTTDKNYLHQFEQLHPSLEPLVKTLLRAYEGIYDQPVPVSEKFIASLLRNDAADVKKQLLELHQSGVIDYQPQKDTPQLLLLKGRIKAEDITINMLAFNQRKERYLQRVKEIVRYVKETTECRSRIIGVYFGDDHIKTCGICDNCLRQKAVNLTKEEFDQLHHRVITLVKYESLPVKELLLKLNGVKKEKAWKVIEFLQAEHKIEMDTNGYIRLK